MPQKASSSAGNVSGVPLLWSPPSLTSSRFVHDDPAALAKLLPHRERISRSAAAVRFRGGAFHPADRLHGIQPIPGNKPGEARLVQVRHLPRNEENVDSRINPAGGLAAAS